MARKDRSPGPSSASRNLLFVVCFVYSWCQDLIRVLLIAAIPQLLRYLKWRPYWTRLFFLCLFLLSSDYHLNHAIGPIGYYSRLKSVFFVVHQMLELFCQIQKGNVYTAMFSSEQLTKFYLVKKFPKCILSKWRLHNMRRQMFWSEELKVSALMKLKCLLQNL